MDPESLSAIVSSLNQAEVVFVIVGGVAVIAHGYLRVTTDLDLVIALDSDNCLRAMRALDGLGFKPRAPVKAEQFADSRERSRWITEKGMVVFQLVSDKHPMCPIDVFVSEPFDVAQEARLAVQADLAPGIAAPILRIEQLLALKKAANRPTDQDDVAKLVKLRSMLPDHE